MSVQALESSRAHFCQSHQVSAMLGMRPIGHGIRLTSACLVLDVE